MAASRSSDEGASLRDEGARLGEEGASLREDDSAGAGREAGGASGAGREAFGEGDAVRAAFDAWVGKLDHAMFILTTVNAAGERAGCLIGFATQTSIDPPRFLACVSHRNRTYRVAREAELLAVHLVPADGQELAELFGGETGDELDKFERCEWRAGPGGVPLLQRCENWFVGRILTRVEAGDHDGFLLAPIAAGEGGAETPSELGAREAAARIDPGHPA